VVRWLRLNIEVVVGVAATAAAALALLWMWIGAENQTKQDTLSSSLLSGLIIAVAVVAVERRAEIRQRRSQHFTQFSSPADLPGVHAEGADLRNVSISNKDLTQAVLRYANLRDVQFGSCKMQGVDLRRADLRRGRFYSSDMSGVDLRGATTRGAFFGGSNLHVARCGRADFSGANFVDTHFDLADLSDATFRGAVFAGRSAGGGPCRSASLRGCWLYGADFRGAIFVVKDRDERFPGEVVGVDLAGAMANEETKWPVGFDPRKAGVIVLPGKLRAHGEPAWVDPGVDDLTGSGLDSWPVSHTDPYAAPQ
jgi:uncharacterized protein YjbI with pentapeptide repeats